MPAVVRSKSLATILLEKKLLSEVELKQLLEESKKKSKSLLNAIIESNIIDRVNLLQVLSSEWKVKAVDLDEIDIDPDIAKIVPETAERRHKVIPFAKEENALFVAMADPRDFFVLEDIQLRTGYKVQPYLSLPQDIERILDKVYGVGEALSKILSTVKSPDEEGNLSLETRTTEEEKIDITEVDVSTPEVEKLVNAIILGAIQKHASDIHIEPFENRLLVRYRIDGILNEAPFVPPYQFRSAIIAKIKIMTRQMDITERRRPQDGRIQLSAAGKPLEFRVSIIPTVFGESCVMRILDRSVIRVSMDKLGFLEDNLDRLQRSLRKPYGLILVSGPTGSGKSTTLYSALNSINHPEIKILTAEDPVEYNLEGIVQLNVNTEIGLDFAAALRAYLRQDPDVIMVGEIRDKETATIAMEAAMTGHLVLSTIHTNDAATAVARLHDMGVYNFLISSTVECVLAQRLVRHICPECSETISPSPELLSYFTENEVDTGDLKLCRGKGCSACNQSGYKGRLGIHELLVMDDELRALILKETASGPIAELAKKQGMRPLIADGLIKVSRGLTTLDEILRVSQ